MLFLSYLLWCNRSRCDSVGLSKYFTAVGHSRKLAVCVYCARDGIMYMFVTSTEVTKLVIHRGAVQTFLVYD